MAQTNDHAHAIISGPEDNLEKSISIADVQEGDDGDCALPFSAKLRLKLDLRLLTPMVLLNFLSLMGRMNIGNALIQGLPTDLRLTSTKTFVVTVMPVIMLMLFEIPSNLLMRWLERAYGLPYLRYLSLITIGLGIVTLGQGFDQNYGSLVATRFLVGVFDAGLIPGCVFTLALYYPGEYLQWRMSMVMIGNLAANIVSNILAYAIALIRSSNSFHGWRWIFILEGCLTIASGLICCWSNTGRPDKAKFLTQTERDTISSKVEARTTNARAKEEWKVFLSSPLNYAWAALYILTCTTIYSVAIFSPTFVQVFHPDYTVPQVQGQVVPIFIASAAACLLWAWLADYLDHRAGLAMIGYALTIAGYGILVTEPSEARISMLGLYLVAMGSFSCLPLIWTLTCINLATPFQQGIGCGFITGIGSTGGFVSAWIFRSSQKPKYHEGMTVGLVLTSVALGITGSAWLYIVMENKRRHKARTGSSAAGDRSKSCQVFKYRA